MKPTENFTLGYLFNPNDRPHHPGHLHLDIMLLAQPSKRHFDPEKVRLMSVTAQKNLEQLEVYHPWRWPKDVQVSVGRIRMIDRKNKVVEAFTYGGTLQIDSTEERTFCVHRSPAAIIELTSVNPISRLLAQETEILLAERRAAWAHDPDRLAARLVSIDPIALYAACLDAILDKYRHFPASAGDTLHRFIHFLSEEIRYVHSQHRLPTKNLTSLL